MTLGQNKIGACTSAQKKDKWVTVFGERDLIVTDLIFQSFSRDFSTFLLGTEAHLKKRSNFP